MTSTNIVRRLPCYQRFSRSSSLIAGLTTLQPAFENARPAHLFLVKITSTYALGRSFKIIEQTWWKALPGIRPLEKNFDTSDCDEGELGFMS